MAEETGIEWCDSTFNPWIGCTKISPACDNCYAERSTPARTLGVAWGSGEPRRRTSAANWELPGRWQRQAAEFKAQHGRRRRVFCASLADVFDNEVDSAWRDELMGLIVDTPDLDWLLLTKRIGNVATMIKADAWRHLGNVWLGITVVNQSEVDRDVPKLLRVPAARRFLSVEPMLGPINLGFEGPCDHARRSCDDVGCWRALSWVICGGESGQQARPIHPDWARSLRNQCAEADVPFFFKQWGEWIGADQAQCPAGPPASRWMWGDGAAFRYGEPAGQLPLLCRAGKKVAGALLDGREHKAWPA